MHWATTYLKISFLGQKLWPPAIKRFIFETPFEGPLLPCETDQVPYLCHFSSDQDEIWCAKAPWGSSSWLVPNLIEQRIGRGMVLCFLLYRFHLHRREIWLFWYVFPSYFDRGFLPLPRGQRLNLVAKIYLCYVSWLRMCQLFPVLTGVILKSLKKLPGTWIGLVGTSHLIKHTILSILAISDFRFL